MNSFLKKKINTTSSSHQNRACIPHESCLKTTKTMSESTRYVIEREVIQWSDLQKRNIAIQAHHKNP